MYRWLARIVAAGVGGGAGWYVYREFSFILDAWVYCVAFGTAAFVVVFALLYFPLLRHVADMIEDQVSTVSARLTARKTGLGFDQVPPTPRGARHDTGPVTVQNTTRCGICGGLGGPVCESCRDKMAHS